MATVSMIIDNKVVETKVIPDSHLQIDGYLKGLKDDMIERNEDIIDLSKSKPEFKVKGITKKVIRN